MDRITSIGIAIGAASGAPSFTLALIGLVPAVGWTATALSLLVPAVAAMLAATAVALDRRHDPGLPALTLGTRAGRPAGVVAAAGAVGAHVLVGLVQAGLTEGLPCFCIWQLGFVKRYVVFERVVF